MGRVIDEDVLKLVFTKEIEELRKDRKSMYCWGAEHMLSIIDKVPSVRVIDETDKSENMEI